MGRAVTVRDTVCASHNPCFVCRTPEEFSEKLQVALASEPEPLSQDDRRRLTWEAATERFLDVAELRLEERPGPVDAAVDAVAFSVLNAVNGASLR
jgi:digalactosyldiacylglycerol synthase